MSAITEMMMALIFSSSSRRCGNVCKRSEGQSCGKRCLRAAMCGVGAAAAWGRGAWRRDGVGRGTPVMIAQSC